MLDVKFVNLHPIKNISPNKINKTIKMLLFTISLLPKMPKDYANAALRLDEIEYFWINVGKYAPQRLIHPAAIEIREDNSGERGLSGAYMQTTADWLANPCVKMYSPSSLSFPDHVARGLNFK